MSTRIVPPTIFETFPRIVRNTVKPLLLNTSTPHTRPIMSSGAAPSSVAGSISANVADYNFQTKLPSSSSTSLDSRQSLLTNSVLDLFAGYPTKRKLALWIDEASFHDPLTIAEGRKQYESQWYGLKSVMSEIHQQHVEVVRAGNPIELKLKTLYKVKGIGSEQVIDSHVLVHLDGDGQRIVKVEDRWDGKIPDNAFAKAFRNLNSVTVPIAVSVPKSIEEEEGTAKR
ncbi:hypothetical protein PV10_03738 [Exophiala mesophila]|uniref:Uncharacterized protein n=1 Tax=Exophiala mesophila TaxID=212818 RepID=A0A0D1ZEY2_EXOME|nr:uncharacterized protein PV10_03738 [Exophiala mesophila]KIV92439.1 hypothetical protein PV10_03738 [Exophiala mesophila]